MTDRMMFLTGFADQAVVLPLLLLVAVALAAAGWRRGATGWLLAVAATLAAVLAAKLVLAACGPWQGLRNPSGHTAAAAVAYGGLAALLLRPRPSWAGVLLPAGCAALIGLSRLAIGVHTPADVVAGAAIGIPGGLVLQRLAGPRPEGLHIGLPLGAALAAMIVFHGAHLDAEEPIRHAARLVFPFCKK